MSNPYDPYSGQQPQQPQQPPADPAAPTQFVPVGGQPPAAPGYGGQPPAAPPQQPNPWQQPAQPFGAPGPNDAPAQQQPAAFGAPAQGAPGWGQGAPGQPQGFGGQPQGFGQPQQGFGGYPSTPSPAPKKGGAGRILAALVTTILGRVILIALIGGGIAIYSFATTHNASRGSNGQVNQAGKLGVADLRVGDCFNAPTSSSNIESINAIPCTQAHDSQVYSEQTIKESTLPDNSTLQSEAQSDCDSAASSVNPAPPSDVQEQFYVPQDQTSFDAGDKSIVCVLQSTSANLTQSYVPAG